MTTEQREPPIMDLGEGHVRLLESLPDALLVVDEGGRIAHANRQAHRLFGYGDTPLVGKPLGRLLPERYRDAHGAHVGAFFAEARARPMGSGLELFGLRADGGEFPVDVSLSPIATVEGPRVLAAVRDMTARHATAEALKLAEARYRDLYENAPDMLASVEPTSGRIVGCNRTFATTLGFTKDEIVGRTVLELHHPDDQQRADRILRTFRETGEVRDAETALLCKDGSKREVSLSVSAVRDENGNILHSRSSCRDITERKSMERALRASEERFRRVFECAQVGLALVDRDGRPSVANRTMREIMGYSEEAFTKTRCVELTHPEDASESDRLFQQLVEGDRDRYRLEKRYRRPDGTLIWGDTAVTAVRDERGAFLYGVPIVMDVTEKRESQEALRRSEELFRQVADNIREVFWLLEPQTMRILYVSPAYDEIRGRGRQEIGDDLSAWLEPIHPDDRGRIRTVLTSARPGPYKEEYRIVRPDGSVRWLRERGFPVRTPGGQIHRVAGITEDVTEQKHLGEQLWQAQKMEAVGQVTSGVAHDFNNLLSVIIGYTDLLRADLDDEDPMAADVEQIAEAARRGAGLTRQLLTFSRKQIIRPRVVDLDEIVTGLEPMLRRVLGEHLGMETRLGRDLGSVKVDPSQIEQVVINLAVNARDAMPLGGRLTITTANVELDEEYARHHVGATVGPHVMLAVSDTGQGMDERTRAQIFEPFFTTKETGTGLGLSTVFGVVKRSGGSIEVYSERGHGTTFKVYLPRVDESAGEPGAALPA